MPTTVSAWMSGPQAASTSATPPARTEPSGNEERIAARRASSEGTEPLGAVPGTPGRDSTLGDDTSVVAGSDNGPGSLPGTPRDATGAHIDDASVSEASTASTTPAARLDVSYVRGAVDYLTDARRCAELRQALDRLAGPEPSTDAMSHAAGAVAEARGELDDLKDEEGRLQAKKRRKRTREEKDRLADLPRAIQEAQELLTRATETFKHEQEALEAARRKSRAALTSPEATNLRALGPYASAIGNLHAHLTVQRAAPAVADEVATGAVPLNPTAQQLLAEVAQSRGQVFDPALQSLGASLLAMQILLHTAGAPLRPVWEELMGGGAGGQTADSQAVTYEAWLATINDLHTPGRPLAEVGQDLDLVICQLAQAIQALEQPAPDEP